MATVDKVLRNSGAELQVTFFVDGAPTDADGAVTVVVTTAQGVELFDGVADDATTSDGRYEWDLSPQADLTRLTLAWTGLFNTVSHTVTTHAEIVGQHLFSINEARLFRGGKLSDDVKYTNDEIVDVREEIGEMFERYCQVSFIPRYRRETHDGNSEKIIYLDRREVSTVQTVTEDGVSLSVGTDITSYSSGRLVRENGVWSSTDRQNVIVDFEHGWEAPPGAIVRAALVVLHSNVIGSDVMDRKVSQTDDSGTFRLSFPDATRDRPTGIPYVDARLNEYLDLWGIN